MNIVCTDDVQYIITPKLLGKGAFGTVYLANNQNGKQYAIKCCEIKNDKGIPYLLEIVIMSTLSHPYLNKAERIHCSEKTLYIIQELARTDLAHYTRRNKENYRPSLEKLKHWCYCLMKAVSSLHNNNIIHADIKASNILLFDDDLIKLADFTLSVKKRNKEEKFTHNVCTATHRPLEVLNRKEWDETVDIWALGCTLYEIAYGTLLFLCQNDINKAKSRQKYVDAILEWDGKLKFGICTHLKKYIDAIIEDQSKNYFSPIICEEANNQSMKSFNDLLSNMLIVDASKRQPIKKLLSHQFINNMPITYMSVKCSKKVLSNEDIELISDYIRKITTDEYIIKLAINIYSNLPNTICNIIEIELHAMTCGWIAHKLINKDIPDISETILPIILEMERNICHNLTFRIDLS